MEGYILQVPHLTRTRYKVICLMAHGINGDFPNIFTLCPEGMGVNVFQTAHAAGLVLEPTGNLHTVRLVALLGYGKAGISRGEV